MAEFSNGSLNISYLDEGAGPPVLLIHGFASTKEINWVGPQWVKTLTGAGSRVIALDNRGHGQSAKPHDPALYTPQLMAGDALRLLDRLDVERCDVIGYSMGARLALVLASLAPRRVRMLCLGGVGLKLVEGMSGTEAIAAALEAEDPAAISDPAAKAYRIFADQTKSDRLALAACVTSMRVPLGRDMLAGIDHPVLIAVGTKDVAVGSPQGLADLFPDARVLALPERDHMSAVGDKVHKDGVLNFLRMHA